MLTDNKKILLTLNIFLLLFLGACSPKSTNHPSENIPNIPEISLTRDDQNQLYVGWLNDASATAYRVYQSSDSTFELDNTEFTDVSNNYYRIPETSTKAVMYYRVSSLHASLESYPSKTIQSLSPPLPPNSIKVELSNGKNLIKWQGEGDLFSVYWFDGENPESSLSLGKHTGIRSNSFLHEVSALKENGQFYYTVVSVKDTIESRFALTSYGRFASKSVIMEESSDTQTQPDAQSNSLLRTSQNLQVLYSFSGTSIAIVRDISGIKPSIDLDISGDVVHTNTGLLFNYTDQTNDGIAISLGDTSKRINSAIAASDEVTIEAWITPKSISPGILSRIVTLSSNSKHRNISLLQDDNWRVRVRNQNTTANGTLDEKTEVNALDNSITVGQKTHLIYSHKKDGSFSLFVNGIIVDEGYYGQITEWESSYQLALGNEFHELRPWKGEMHLVAIYDRALSTEEILQNYNAGSKLINDDTFFSQQNNDGLISIEAENFNSKNASPSGHYWDDALKPNAAGFAMQALPVDNVSWYWEEDISLNSPMLSYDVNFIRAGTYYVWARVWAPDSSSDSLHVGIDDIPVFDASNLNGFSKKTWNWSNSSGDIPRAIEVSNIGVHTINIWMRDSGTIVDKVLLTNDSAFTPVDLGPSESTKVFSSQAKNLVTPSIVTVTASSQHSDNTGPLMAIDGVVDGWPNGETNEWVSDFELSGAWIQFDWTSNVLINRLELHDRIGEDQILNGELIFSDQTSVFFDELNNNGAVKDINLDHPKLSKSLRVHVINVSGVTKASGLAEVKVFGFQ